MCHVCIAVTSCLASSVASVLQRKSCVKPFVWISTNLYICCMHSLELLSLMTERR